MPSSAAWCETGSMSSDWVKKVGNFARLDDPGFKDYLGWLTANTIGLRHDAVLAMKDGIWDTRGVISSRLPKAAIRTTAVYGVQIKAHKATLVMATLAIRTSAVSALAS